MLSLFPGCSRSSKFQLPGTLPLFYRAQTSRFLEDQGKGEYVAKHPASRSEILWSTKEARNTWASVASLQYGVQMDNLPREARTAENACVTLSTQCTRGKGTTQSTLHSLHVQVAASPRPSCAEYSLVCTRAPLAYATNAPSTNRFPSGTFLIFLLQNSRGQLCSCKQNVG